MGAGPLDRRTQNRLVKIRGQRAIIVPGRRGGCGASWRGEADVVRAADVAGVLARVLAGALKRDGALLREIVAG